MVQLSIIGMERWNGKKRKRDKGKGTDKIFLIFPGPGYCQGGQR